jgi:hypothetical protein
MDMYDIHRQNIYMDIYDIPNISVSWFIYWSFPILVARYMWQIP